MHVTRLWPVPRSSKVPAITGLFWVIKVLTTAMGEDASDYLVHQFGKAPAVVAGLAVFLVGLYVQLRCRAYNRWAYWFAVSMVALFGTMAADVLHLGLGVPYVVSTMFFLVVLISVFVLWRRVEGTLSITSITTQSRELFYWATVVSTFALGTAAGDMTARTLHWGYLNSGLIFAALFLLPGLLYAVLRSHVVLFFWTSYVLTRPFGASFADLFGADKSLGGKGYGYGATAVVLSVAIVLLVGLSKRTGKHVARHAA